MSTKRYQIFVSSTLKDLEEQRKIALKIVLDLGHFPAGMEAFPATDDSSWELIKQVIDDSDYYIVIVAGRYGSCDDNGESYTEKEYNYAIQQGKPAVAFIHSEPQDLSNKNVEQSEDGKKKLESFKSRIQSARNFKPWKNDLELQGAIYQAINHMIRTKPALGWTRQANGPGVDELNRRLVELQAKYDNCKAQLESFKERLVFIDDVLVGSAKFDYVIIDGRTGKRISDDPIRAEIEWQKIFFHLSKEFSSGSDWNFYHLSSLLEATVRQDGHPDSARVQFLGDGLFVIAHLFSQGLVNSQIVNYPSTSSNYTSLRSTEIWSLTELGKKLYYKHLADSALPE